MITIGSLVSVNDTVGIIKDSWFVRSTGRAAYLVVVEREGGGTAEIAADAKDVSPL